MGLRSLFHFYIFGQIEKAIAKKAHFNERKVFLPTQLETEILFILSLEILQMPPRCFQEKNLPEK